MRRRKLHILLPALVTLAVPIMGVPAAHAATTDPTGRPEPGVAQVTLITGDRVTTAGTGVTIQPGPGRTRIHFLSQTDHGDRYVIPSDALPLLSSGRLDRRLFDVTALGAAGYTDHLPLLFKYAGNRPAALTGARLTRDLAALGMSAVRSDASTRPALWASLTSGAGSTRSLRPGIDRVWLDGKRTISLDRSVPQIGAPIAWKAGFDGTGVTVGILDTGIDATHPDLADRIVDKQNFTDAPDTDDTVGHGTHVASIIAGSGAASGGRYRGVAPGAKLLIGKVCGDESCSESSILAGMQWAAPRATVINLSLGGQDTPDIDPLEQAVNDLTARYGTLFVIAAGNDGVSVSSPGSADSALTVGAVDHDNKIADFSGRGPRVGDYAVKPDITAPGVDIVAARAAHGTIGDPAPVAGYVSLSGTSMATPHVAGAAAILTQEHPGWTPQQRKTALMASAEPTAGATPFDQGAGRVDVAREIIQTVAADEGSVSFGRQIWPHTDDQPITRTVTYRNDGPAPVKLSLAIQTTAAAGTFTAGTTTLTIAAGSTAQTTLTANTAIDQPDGLLGGYLVATADGGVRVETPFGVNREAESYDITLKNIGRDGAPNDTHQTVFINQATMDAIATDQAEQTIRLPKGTYGVYSWIDDGGQTPDDASGDSTTMLVQPQLVVGSAMTLTFDARTGKPMSVTQPSPDAGNALYTVRAFWQNATGGRDASMIGRGSMSNIFLGQIGPATAPSAFHSTIAATYARANADGSFDNSPYTYDLAWFQRGRFFDGFHGVVRSRNLATLRATYATEATGTTGSKANGTFLDPSDGYFSVFLPFALPFHRTEYVNVEPGSLTQSAFYQLTPNDTGGVDPISQAISTATALQAGRTYPQQWNRGVFGPMDPITNRGRNDVLSIQLPMFGEGPGHPGESTTDTAATVLSSDGKVISKVDGLGGQFTVPAGPARYELDADATRSAPHTLSTAVHATWTFRSQHADSDAQLPLLTVRMSPTLDDHNSAPAGRPYAIPLTASAPLSALGAEVSFDDGHTWQPAPVRGSGTARTATVRHPAKAGFVSLRIHAKDRAGNTVTQTMIRAYQIA